jgi:hypothetical protein
MPSLRIWTPAEAVAATAPEQKNGPSRKDIEQIYDQFLAGVEVGNFAAVTLDEGENKATTRNRLEAAAERRNLTIAFRRTKGDTIVFTVGNRRSHRRATGRRNC